MEDYRQHAASANFIIKCIEFIVGILCGLAFTIILCICSFSGTWSALWPSLLIIPGSGLFFIMLMELARHIYLSFVLKTDYYDPTWPVKAEDEEEKEVIVTDPTANNQNSNK